MTTTPTSKAVEDALNSVLDKINILGEAPARKIQKYLHSHPQIYDITPCSAELNTTCVYIHYATRAALPGCLLFATPGNSGIKNVNLCKDCHLFNSGACICPHRR